MENITKEVFDAYEEVRVSGVTNMWAVDYVVELMGMKGVQTDSDEVMKVMKNYSELAKKFGST